MPAPLRYYRARKMRWAVRYWAGMNEWQRMRFRLVRLQERTFRSINAAYGVDPFRAPMRRG